MNALTASLSVLLAPLAASIAWGADGPSENAQMLDLRCPGLRFIDAAGSARSADLDYVVDAEPLEVVATAVPAKSGSFAHFSRTGLGSIYWALQHPNEAWRVVLAVPQGSTPVLSADMRTMCEAMETERGGAPCA
jgi:hypothetical protein